MWTVKRVDSTYMHCDLVCMQEQNARSNLLQGAHILLSHMHSYSLNSHVEVPVVYDDLQQEDEAEVENEEDDYEEEKSAAKKAKGAVVIVVWLTHNPAAFAQTAPPLPCRSFQLAPAALETALFPVKFELVMLKKLAPYPRESCIWMAPPTEALQATHTCCDVTRVRGAILGRRANGRKGETILAEFGEIADDRR